ncbi:hypothetical protein L6452_21172 [Arctium lappa]|uniref:Uncharacterized protein n=1 Tax=Arctium lappa TaxID=4217 RepID=A0ACB9BD02_ARCLA|nr:hypothetical protein L6452_21172 [Arctium lappa]
MNRSGRISRIKLVAESSPAGDDDNVVAGENVTDFVIAGVVSAGLDECSGGIAGAGGAPDVCLDVKRSECVGNDVVRDGLCSTVGSDQFVVDPTSFSER